ncbi:hypothetical protein BBJ29_005446 [Phytophthora kernoviae]|uniref:RxLR effector protein n=1 Tax=Phytophthora kernoviae TaxID=325452 RepID=A0A3F2RMN7_9STRA|nr:hypothetical protein BBJ29_005446 [Phytophthora kernoviae]RLN60624.1 hypothetical protein BBP00_00005866 [Phytophthora kernoviae]
MKLNALILAMAIMLTLLGSSSANLEGENILRRQLRVGKMVASLFENEHQTKRDLEAQMEDEDNKPKEVQAEPSRFHLDEMIAPFTLLLILLAASPLDARGLRGQDESLLANGMPEQLEDRQLIVQSAEDFAAEDVNEKSSEKSLRLLYNGGDAPPYTGKPTHKPLTLLYNGGDAPPYTGRPLTLLNDGGDAPPYTGRPLTLLNDGGDAPPYTGKPTHKPLTLLYNGGDAPPYTGKPTHKPLTLLNDGGDAPPYTGRPLTLLNDGGDAPPYTGKPTHKPLTLLYNGGDMQPVIAEDF